MNAVTLQQRSPFKFLDSYNKNDKNIFFGRDEEIKALYELVQTSKLVLVYGASGTGKTSLVECGLSNKFSDADWFAVRIRRGNMNLLDASRQAINLKLKEEANLEFDLCQGVEALYYHNFIPIYLIFDQFEEIFIMGDEKERTDFFNAIAVLARIKVPCKILLIVREEYLAFFHDFETLIPIIYDSRFRIERMNQLKLEKVIKGTIQTPQYQIDFDSPEENTRLIIENLRNERHDVDLTNLQVYLDRLYKVDIQRGEQSGLTRPPYKFDKKLIESVGKLPQVISVFLEEQMQDVDKTVNAPNTALTILKLFVTNEGTKRSRSEKGIIEEFEKTKLLPLTIVEECIQILYERRILKELVIGEELRYEISHDLLAGQVFQRFSIEEKELIRAVRMIKDGFEFHKQLSIEGVGVSFLRTEQIFFIQNIKANLDLSEEEKIYFADSVEEAEVERNRDKRILEKELELQKAKAEQEEKAKILQLELFEKEKQEHQRQKTEAQKERERQAISMRTQKQKLYMVFGAGVIMLGMLIAAAYFFNEMNEAFKDLKETKRISDIKSGELMNADSEIKTLYEKNIETNKISKQNEFKYFNEQAIIYRKNNQFIAALGALAGALRVDSTQKDSIDRAIKRVNIEKTAFDRQISLRFSFDSIIRVGSNFLDDSTALNGKLLKPEQYNNAYSTFKKGEQVLAKLNLEKEFNEKRLKEKLKEATVTLERAFEGFINKGKRFEKAKGWKEAITNYERAIALETIEFNKKEEVRKWIVVCKANVKEK
jgi:hypothetical protein